jgi:hypothetical protein
MLRLTVLAAILSASYCGMGTCAPAPSPNLARGAALISNNILIPEPATAYLTRLLHPAAGVCVCGYQPNNHCTNGKVYEFSYCRDSDGQACGTADVDTGNTC